ncbi:hypothetical protein Cni_G02821 [Canna indica]|uniref:DUF4283 domain-containing protein n=1 Tax=Canna indica TaxID=4628 RepID=A0AAQ3Q2S6_9LILI|nr:hypothetical protein Cni_G02821 [Canna indica]
MGKAFGKDIITTVDRLYKGKSSASGLLHTNFVKYIGESSGSKRDEDPGLMNTRTMAVDGKDLRPIHNVGQSLENTIEGTINPSTQVKSLHFPSSVKKLSDVPRGNSRPNSWVNLFKPKSVGSNDFSSFKILSKIKSSVMEYIEFNDFELDEIRKPWFASLIGHFLYKPPTHFHLRNWAFNIWSDFNLVNVIDLENSFFLFRFDSEENAVKVLEGPWAF